jgi:succinate dehydrogenase / fumarate reductase cytochrome b subunit
MHRLTGIYLYLSFMVIGLALVILVQNPEVTSFIESLSGYLLTNLAFLGFVYALVYHWFNGIRHLVWDLGFGFELNVVHLTGWLVVMLSFTFTLFFALVWYL